MANTNDISTNTKLRLIVIGILAVLILVIFLLRLIQLQVVDGLLYQLKAKNVSQKVIEIPSQRGRIYDKNNQNLTANTNLFAVNITPAEVPSNQLKDVLRRVSKLLIISDATIERKIAPENYRLPIPIELKQGVNLETVSYIAEHIEEFPGISWQSKPKRTYLVEGGIGSGHTINHVLGYTGDISTEEIQTLYNEGYRLGDSIGKTGLEKLYDNELRGEKGFRYNIVDATGKQIDEGKTSLQDPTAGNDIYLTIDLNVQKLAEQALGNRRGSIVVLKPHTGEVLALVSNPVFDANLFDKGGETSFAMQSIDPNFPFINRAISAEYAPASTFKMIVTAAILEEKVVSPDFKVFCPGYVQVGNRIFYCHDHNGHGWQNLGDAVANSCNVYYWTIVKDYLGIDENHRPDPSKLTYYAELFGLGNYTEIDIPNEKEGLIPSKTWKEDTWHSAWTGGDTLNMTIGQGFVLATPLQMANAMAFTVNNGITYKPHVLSAIVNSETGETKKIEPQVLHSANLSEETWTTLKSYLRGTTLRGTGWMLTKIVPIAGKTGTGEVGVAGHYHDWYIGYAPYGDNVDPDDQIVVAVQIESSNEYVWWSTKAADMIFQGVFAQQDYYDVLKTLKPWYAIEGKWWWQIVAEHENPALAAPVVATPAPIVGGTP